MTSWLRPGRRAFVLIAAAATAVAVLHALSVAWVTDDAFISFRYAENLTRGLGLVYNAGERVEGYSNLLWTLWSALGLGLGVDAVAWSQVWSIAAFAATVALLAAITWRRTGGRGVPLAALVLAFHRDAAIFATSGLETASFTALTVLGAWILLGGDSPRRLLSAGFVFGLVALSRPDGALFGALAFMWMLLTLQRRGRVLAFAVPLLLMIAAHLAWKLAYYGDILPNTYYAKSASRAWYSQGFVYVGLYFRKYWVLALGAIACAAAAFGAGGAHSSVEDSEEDRGWRRSAGLAALMAIGYTLYVAHVGGDFMFARLLIPTTPFWLMLAELGFERLAPPRPAARWLAAAACAAAVALTPYPFQGQGWVNGIVNEWAFYTRREQVRAREYGMKLRTLFDGLPMRVAFCGGQAVLAYYSRAPLGIETATGLTDSTIAHQPLVDRGRPGHEKKTPIPYLLARDTHVWMYTGTLLSDSLAPYIPLVPLKFDTLAVMAMTWDPPVMDALRARGAEVPDFLGTLDRFIAVMPALPDSDVRVAYDKTRRFYFDHTRDPAREAAFRTRLGLPLR